MTHILINAINDNALPRGPDRYILEVLPHLIADETLNVTIAFAPWQTRFVEGDFGPRVRKHVMHPPRKPALRLLWQAAVFPRLANRINPDAVFLTNSLWNPGMHAPCVMVGHDFLQFRAPEKFGFLKSMLLRSVIKRAVARADRVLAVSEFTANDAIQFTGADPTKVVTILEGGPQAEQRRSNKCERVFLFVGKLEKTKGVDVFIRAFQASPKLIDAGYTAHIIGPDGNASQIVNQLLAQNDTGIVRRGFVSEADLQAAYLSCRGFVFPSTAEGFGLVLLEAMARGAPVIAARATSLPEVVDTAGILIAPNDVEGLTNAMERLAFDDLEFEGLQRAGYDRVATFSWEKAGFDTAALLREVANER